MLLSNHGVNILHPEGGEDAFHRQISTEGICCIILNDLLAILQCII